MKKKRILFEQRVDGIFASLKMFLKYSFHILKNK